MESLLCLLTTALHAEGGIRHNGAICMMGPGQLVMSSTGDHLASPLLTLLGGVVADARLGMVFVLSHRAGLRPVIRPLVAIGRGITLPWLWIGSRVRLSEEAHQCVSLLTQQAQTDRPQQKWHRQRQAPASSCRPLQTQPSSALWGRRQTPPEGGAQTPLKGQAGQPTCRQTDRGSMAATGGWALAGGEAGGLTRTPPLR